MEEKSTHNISKQDIFKREFNPIVFPKQEQLPMVDLLYDQELPVVSIVGEQGAGKTYYGLAAGIQLVKQGIFKNIHYITPLVEIGEQIGFLKGSLQEKIDPWMQSCVDQLTRIYSLDESEEFYRQYPELNNMDQKEFRDKFLLSIFNNKIIEYEIITHIKGRTINNSYIIVDDAHYFSKDQIRMLIGRIGEKSKMVFLSDPKQIMAANPKLAKQYNLSPSKIGMSHLIEQHFSSNKKSELSQLFGHITLPVGFTQRSRAVALGALLN